MPSFMKNLEAIKAIGNLCLLPKTVRQESLLARIVEKFGEEPAQKWKEALLTEEDYDKLWLMLDVLGVDVGEKTEEETTTDTTSEEETGGTGGTGDTSAKEETMSDSEVSERPVPENKEEYTPKDKEDDTIRQSFEAYQKKTDDSLAQIIKTLEGLTKVSEKVIKQGLPAASIKPQTPSVSADEKPRVGYFQKGLFKPSR